jgi:eukaryotic-like serine/threonine-protein kinase
MLRVGWFWAGRDMPEDRMDQRIPPGKPKRAAATGSAPARDPDTKTAHDTVTPKENDPAWIEFGATNTSDTESGASEIKSGIDSPANYTQMASRTVGKDIVSLGDFQLLKKLGEGAMGAVYKARQVTMAGEVLETPHIVAVKILFPHVAGNPKLVARLRREAKVMFDLDHANIVRSFAFDETDGFYYVAMEYVSGQSMQKWLTQLGRIPVADAIRVVLDCARALSYAHQLNMVHRDIKPDNILVSKKGLVKVADFGMVKIEDDDDEMHRQLTQTGHAVGTPWFMPLEQARNAKEIDGRSDIYALGCTLYAFLTGRPPFMGRTIVDVIQAKEAGTFPAARQANSDVPERLDLILAKMTAKLPKNRYQTCDEMIKDLESLGLASANLTFVSAKPTAKSALEKVDTLARTKITSAPMKSRADVDFAASAAPALDLDLWYVQVRMPDGKIKTRKYHTAQLMKMLADGTIAVSARGSHTPNNGFRSLATFKEFQGVALGKTTKEAADKNTARTRGLLKRIEEAERQRETDEKARKGEGETAVSANLRYWGGFFLKIILPIGVAVALLIILVGYLASMFA